MLLVLLLLTVGGVAGLLAMGDVPPAQWGYVAAAVVFVASTLQAAPAVALASRLAHGAWGTSLRRPAELCAVSAVVTAPLTVLLLTKLPNWRLRPSIWL